MVTVRRFWLVEGQDLDGKVIYQQAHPLHYYSSEQMGILLQALTAKSSLSFDEIAAALCRRGKRTALLNVQHLQGEHFTIACGPSLEWTARILPQHDRRLAGLI